MTDDEIFEVMLSQSYGNVSLPDLLTVLANRIERIEKTRENRSEAYKGEVAAAYKRGVVDGIVQTEMDIIKRFTLTPKPLQRGPNPDDLPEGW